MEMMTSRSEATDAKPEQVTAKPDRYEKEIAKAMGLAIMFKKSMELGGADTLSQATVGMLLMAMALSKGPSNGGLSLRNMTRVIKDCMPGIAEELNFDGAETIEGILNPNEGGGSTLMLKGAPFEIGKVVITQGIQEHTQPTFVLKILSRYLTRDWGNQLSEEEVVANNMNADSGVGLIFAIYPIDDCRQVGPENQVYVVTSLDRTETKICLPAEY